MYLGKMIIYNKETGKILNGCLEQRFDSGLTQEMVEELRPDEVEVLNIPYDFAENKFKEALEYHIDVKKDKETTNLKDLIIIDRYREHIETKEEKLNKELLKAQDEIINLKYKELLNNKNLGGK